jgi:hypothetical protein
LYFLFVNKNNMLLNSVREEDRNPQIGDRVCLINGNEGAFMHFLRQVSPEVEGNVRQFMGEVMYVINIHKVRYRNGSHFEETLYDLGNTSRKALLTVELFSIASIVSRSTEEERRNMRLNNVPGTLDLELHSRETHNLRVLDNINRDLAKRGGTVTRSKSALMRQVRQPALDALRRTRDLIELNPEVYPLPSTRKYWKDGTLPTDEDYWNTR